MVAAFKANNTMKMTAESDGDKSDTDSVTLEESEDFFQFEKKMRCIKWKRGLVLK